MLSEELHVRGIYPPLDPLVLALAPHAPRGRPGPDAGRPPRCRGPGLRRAGAGPGRGRPRARSSARTRSPSDERRYLGLRGRVPGAASCPRAGARRGRSTRRSTAAWEVVSLLPRRELSMLTAELLDRHYREAVTVAAPAAARTSGTPLAPPPHRRGTPRRRGARPEAPGARPGGAAPPRRGSPRRRTSWRRAAAEAAAVARRRGAPRRRARTRPGVLLRRRLRRGRARLAEHARGLAIPRRRGSSPRGEARPLRGHRRARLPRPQRTAGRSRPPPASPWPARATGASPPSSPSRPAGCGRSSAAGFPSTSARCRSSSSAWTRRSERSPAASAGRQPEQDDARRHSVAKPAGRGL